jgi:two-component system, OmpR family, response regulator MprA
MTVPRKPWSVLMVDDNPAMREAIARSLARRGCAVTTVADAAEALASLRRQLCDVVVTDLNMPQHGGLWLWRQAVMLRPELRGRFVLIASEPLPEPRSLELFLESERFLLKPLSLDALWRLVEEAMQGAPPVASAGRVDSQAQPAGRVGGAP